MEKNKNIEKRILWVAERLFLEKGFNGTSTTEIAKAVGCNQALIHYYFRTKEKLFWDIFSPKMEQAVEYLDAPLDEGVDFFERISNVIDLYFGMMSLDERLAPFIVNELLMSPARWTMFRERFLRNESSSQAFVKFEKMVNKVINDRSCYSLSQLKISGSDLIKQGCSPGKELGEILEKLLNMVISGDCENNKKALIEAYKQTKKDA